MKVQKFEEYTQSYIDVFCKDFLKGLLSDNLQEGSDDGILWEDTHKKSILDLNTNLKFLSKFNTISFYPIINSLLKNINKNIEPSVIVDIVICAIAIIYVDEKKNKLTPDEKGGIVKEIQSGLEEFRLQGVYGVVKKVVKCLQSIRTIFNIISKQLGKVIYSFFDLFSYPSLLTSINGIISNLINKHKIDLDTLPGILIGAGSGLTTLVANNFIVDLVAKLKDRFDLKTTQVDDIESNLGVEEITNIQPIIRKFSEFTPINDGELNNNA